MSTSTSGLRLACTIPVALVFSACADTVGPRVPSHDEPPAPSVGLDVLGGDAAIEALRELVEEMEKQGRHDEVPVNALEFLRGSHIDQPTQPTPRFSTDGSTTITGPYYINGIEHYEENGVYYPPGGTSARVNNPYTAGFLNDGSGVVNAGFAFDGHGGTQSTRWEVRHSQSRDLIASNTISPFGSASRRFFSTSGTVAGHVTIKGLPPCDITLHAATNHDAWYDGSWFSSISIGITSPLSITINRTRDGLAHGYSQMPYVPEVHCSVSTPGDDEECEFDLAQSKGAGSPGALAETIGSARLDCGTGGDGDGGYQDEITCWACQQWFWYENGQIVEEWWECHEVETWRCGLAS
ncbi:MAG TPA: hypothetical protein VMM18_05665 [Gemmatimonadaceae bacterium]|nr:hypothetical protein [Gemmatimonadaceae bacterium]